MGNASSGPHIADAALAGSRRSSGLLGFFRRLVREKPLGTVGGTITLLFLLIGVFADFLAPHGVNEIHRGQALAAPSAEFWLGTDNIGRDLLSRVIFGARISVIIGLAASTLSTLISVVLGMLSGYLGGVFDLIAQRLVDAWMSFPGLVFLIVIISLIGPGMWQIIGVLGILWGVSGSRIIRGATIAIRENIYLQAATAIGCSTVRVLVRHVLTNIMAPTIVLFSVTVPGMILAEASLSFLGFGIPPPAPSWGGMLSGSGSAYMFLAPWMVLWPGLALSIVVYGTNMFGDAVRDLLDPRLRGGAGRYGRPVTNRDRAATTAARSAD